MDKLRKFAQQATEADSAGRYAEALDGYKNTVQCIVYMVRMKEYEASKERLMRQAEAYLARAKTLESVLKMPGVASAAYGRAAEHRGERLLREAKDAVREAAEEERKADAAMSRLTTVASRRQLDRAVRAYEKAASRYVEALECLHAEGADGGDVGMIGREEEFAKKVLQKAKELKDRARVAGPGTTSGLGLRGSGIRGVVVGGRKHGLWESEVGVLRRSSLINGTVFLPWLAEDAVGEAFPAVGERWCHPDGLPALSIRQTERLLKWARSDEIAARHERSLCVVRGKEGASPFAITQQLVPDCSFVAALVVCASYEKRHKRRFLTNLIWPKDKDGHPRISPTGKYQVLLHINGYPRKVLVDDRLPVDAAYRPLCSFSKDLGEIWVSILEKAFISVVGSYAFPGSNSAQDLHMLTGWIPETFTIRDINADSVWKRLFSAHQYGDVLVNLSTPSDVPESTGLVSTHAYAVLDLRQVDDLRMLLIKNPWSRQRWNGRFGPTDRVWQSDLGTRLGYDARSEAAADNGVFWMEWSDVLRMFSNISANWRPTLLPIHARLHGTWPKDARGPLKDQYDLGFNPQFVLRVHNDKESEQQVWLLLERHVTKIDPDDNKSVEVSDGEVTLGGGGATVERRVEDKLFLALHVFGKEGDDEERKRGRLFAGDTRVHYGNDALVFGVHYGGQFRVTKLSVPAGRHVFPIVLSQFTRTFTVDYTLRVYSSVPFSLEPLEDRLETRYEARSEWSGAAGTIGGRVTSVDYFENPQFLIQVDQVCDIKIELRHPTSVFASARLASLLAHEQRMDSFGRDRFEWTTGSYRPAFAYGVLRAAPVGRYALVVATYDPTPADKRAPCVVKCNLPIQALPTRAQKYGLPTLFQIPLPSKNEQSTTLLRGRGRLQVRSIDGETILRVHQGDALLHECRTKSAQGMCTSLLRCEPGTIRIEASGTIEIRGDEWQKM